MFRNQIERTLNLHEQIQISTEEEGAILNNEGSEYSEENPGIANYFPQEVIQPIFSDGNSPVENLENHQSPEGLNPFDPLTEVQNSEEILQREEEENQITEIEMDLGYNVNNCQILDAIEETINSPDPNGGET